jgi:hypothetical protein
MLAAQLPEIAGFGYPLTPQASAPAGRSDPMLIKEMLEVAGRLNFRRPDLADKLQALAKEMQSPPSPSIRIA